jgi:glucokinase
VSDAGGAKEGLALGIDIGGTKVQIALVDAAGAVLGERRIPSAPEKGVRGVVAEIAAAARAEFGVAFGGACGVGMSVAGQVDAAGVVVGAPNLGWTRAPLGAELAAAFGLPVHVANDVRAATLAEWRFGAGRGFDDVVVLFLGTGIGGGIVSGGRLLEGAGGFAGEFGHATVVADGRPCHCRNRGCIEAYAGGWAIAERAREAALADAAAGAVLLALAGGDADAIAAETVAAARDRGDALAVRLVAETGHYLGAALVGLVNGLNPARVVLGGGVLEGFPELVTLAAAEVLAHALPAAAAGVAVVPATLGTYAPVVGAAALAPRGGPPPNHTMATPPLPSVT